MSLCLLADVVFVCGGTGGVGGSARNEAGDESSMMGSALVLPAFSECVRILDGRLMGESVAGRRRLRSELREDDESVRGKGRFGRVYREEDAIMRASEAVAGSNSPVGSCWLTPVSLPSLKKSIHVSLSCARKCDATTPSEGFREPPPMYVSCCPCTALLAPSPRLSWACELCACGLLGRETAFGDMPTVLARAEGIGDGSSMWERRWR